LAVKRSVNAERIISQLTVALVSAGAKMADVISLSSNSY